MRKKIDHNQLKEEQSMPLEDKIELSKQKIREWHEHFDGKVYVSFSGGKDSTVLLHLVRSIYPDVLGVFMDTGLEYPEIRQFVKETDNIKTVKPKMSFLQVIEKYGYPVISKENSYKLHEIMTTKSDKLRNKRLYGDARGNGKLPEKWKFLLDAPFKISSQCCNVMKKSPSRSFERRSGLHPIVGTMAGDSRLRQTAYMQRGCNVFDSKRPMSTPMSFWVEKDIWDYIKTYNISYSKIYDMGYRNTGCMFCMFGVHLNKNEKNKFQLMEKTHPEIYKYLINDLGLGGVMDYCGIKYWNEKEIFDIDA